MKKTTDISQHINATAGIIKFYEQALELVKNAPDTVKKEYSVLLEEDSIERALSILRISKEFQIPLVLSSSSHWITVEGYPESQHMNIGFYPKDGDRKITWSDDERQPEDEYLLVISFPTGPYIFGSYFRDNYPKDTFNTFFEELRSYGPKYADTANHTLYFTADAASNVYWNFNDVMEKYQAIATEENNRHRRERLEEELRILDSVSQ